MDPKAQIKTLQLTYAAQLVDTVRRYADAGILEKVTEERRAERLADAPRQAAQMGITAPSQTFTALAELFGCADWRIVADESGFTATSPTCLLFALARKLGAPEPCRLYCLDPMEAIVMGLAPEAGYGVEATLFEGAPCRVRVTVPAAGA
jgi:hypothetical protein